VNSLNVLLFECLKVETNELTRLWNIQLSNSQTFKQSNQTFHRKTKKWQ